MLRFFHYVALVVAVVLACAGATSPGLGTGTAVSASLASVSLDRANVDRSAAPTPDLPARHAVRMRAVVEKESEESDLDDEEAPVCDIAEAPSFRSTAFPRGSKSARRAHLPGDTSRFAAGPGLPRGPPRA